MTVIPTLMPDHDPAQMALLIEMMHAAALLPPPAPDTPLAVVFEIILALVQAGDHLHEDRYAGLVQAGAMLLRLRSELDDKRG